MGELGSRCHVFMDVDKIVNTICNDIKDKDQIIIMSNGAFNGVHRKIIERLN